MAAMAAMFVTSVQIADAESSYQSQANRYGGAEMDEEERTAVYPVRHIAYEPSGSFELAAGGEASGKIFTCALESPNPLTHVAIHDATITTDDTLDTVIEKFSHNDVESLPVFDAQDIEHPVGVITRKRLMQAYQVELDRE